MTVRHHLNTYLVFAVLAFGGIWFLAQVALFTQGLTENLTAPAPYEQQTYTAAHGGTR